MKLYIYAEPIEGERTETYDFAQDIEDVPENAQVLVIISLGIVPESINIEATVEEVNRRNQPVRVLKV
jgi:hypothetical protein